MIKIKPSTRNQGKIYSEEEAESTSDGEEAEKKEEKKGADINQKESNGPFVVGDEQPATPARNKYRKNPLKGLIEDLPPEKCIA